MNTKPKTKLLTIGLICCGRAETTERCLKSLMPLREAIDSEIQVVDTGCSPETRAIVEKYADEVFDFKWINDFAAARNFQLDQANGKMFLYLDDDEFFIDCKYAIEFFQQPDCLSYNLGGYYQRNYLNWEASEFQDVEVVRMCSVTPETHFVGKVHEYIEPAYGNTMFLDMRAGHFGYIFDTPEANEARSIRNIPLLLDMMEEQPENLRWIYQLVQEYRSIDKYDELIKYCEKGIEQTYESTDRDAIRYRGTFVVGLGIGYAETKQNDKVIELYRKYKESKDIMEVPLAKLGVYASRAMFMQSKDEECVEACNHYINTMHRFKDDRGMVFIQGGIFIHNVFEDYNRNAIYSYIMACGMKKDDFGPLVHYYRKIAWDSPVVRINRGFLIILLKKAAEYGAKKEISDVLNKFFVRPGLRDVIENEISLSCNEMDNNQLGNIKAAFKGTKGEKEMNCFLDIRLLENDLAAKEDYGSFREIMEDAIRYADLTKAWREIHLEWMEPKSDPNKDCTEYILGDSFSRFNEIIDTDPKLALTILKDSLGLRVKMDGFIQQLSTFYAEYRRVMEAKKANPEKFQEMYNLEESVLQQIAALDAAGRSEEAIATYQQLVEIIRNTYRVDSLHV